jgi:serine protease Do
MPKKQITALIILTIILSLFVNIFFGRWLSAKISTLSVLNKFKILSPQTPIVINNQQVVRTSDSTDLLQAANAARSRISTVASVDGNGNVIVSGGAVNITSDGIFATGVGTFAAQGQKYFVVLSDGTTSLITATTTDASLGLVFFKTALTNVTPADLGSSSNLLPGDKIVFLGNSLQSFMPHFSASFVSRSQSDVQDLVFDADKPSRSFLTQSPGPLNIGEAAINLQGQVVGIWNGTALISSDVLDHAIGLYLANNTKIIRPSFGFAYTIITKIQSALSGMPQGALVKDSIKNKNGTVSVEQGDIIMTADGNAVSESNPLEIILEKYKPGDTVQLSVQRNKQKINVVVKAQ